jgi:hypothetical protein
MTPSGLMESALDIVRDELLAPVETALRSLHGKDWLVVVNDVRTQASQRPIKARGKRVFWTPDELLWEASVLLKTSAGVAALTRAPVGAADAATIDALTKCLSEMMFTRNMWAHRDRRFHQGRATQFIDDGAKMLSAVGCTDAAERLRGLIASTPKQPETSSTPSPSYLVPPATREASVIADLIARSPAAQSRADALENIRRRRARLLTEPTKPDLDASIEPEPIPIVDAPETFAQEFWERQKERAKPPKKPTEKPKGKPTKAPHLTVHDGSKDEPKT